MISNRDIMAAAEKIAQRFKPQRIVLFGSYAYGHPTQHSDVDILVLIKGRHVHDRALEIRQAIDFGFPVDLLVRSPEEFERRILLGDFFLKEIHEKGKVLYQAVNSRMGGKGRGRLQYRPARSSSKKVTQLR